MVTQAYISLYIWHVPYYPGGTIDMPESLWYDVLRMSNLRDAVSDSDEVFYDPGKYKDYEEDIPTESTRFSI